MTKSARLAQKRGGMRGGLSTNTIGNSLAVLFLITCVGISYLIGMSGIDGGKGGATGGIASFKMIMTSIVVLLPVNALFALFANMFDPIKNPGIWVIINILLLMTTVGIWYRIGMSGIDGGKGSASGGIAILKTNAIFAGIVLVIVLALYSVSRFIKVNVDDSE
jgi:hypothetical protein